MHDGAHIYAKHAADRAGSACVSMPPHADTPGDRKQARNASYQTQIVTEGQKRVDVASVAQTQGGDPLTCDRPYRLSLEAHKERTHWAALLAPANVSTIDIANGAGERVK